MQRIKKQTPKKQQPASEETKAERVQIPVRMDAPLRQLVSIYAGKDQVSANQFIVTAIENEIEQRFEEDLNSLESQYDAMKSRVDAIARKRTPD